ncbi:RNA chaperone Hfq [Bacillus cereus]
MHTQENFYKKLIEEQRVVTIFLLNGVRVPGIIIAVDKFSVLVSSHGKQQFLDEGYRQHFGKKHAKQKIK